MQYNVKKCRWVVGGGTRKVGAVVHSAAPPLAHVDIRDLRARMGLERRVCGGVEWRGLTNRALQTSSTSVCRSSVHGMHASNLSADEWKQGGAGDRVDYGIYTRRAWQPAPQRNYSSTESQ